MCRCLYLRKSCRRRCLSWWDWLHDSEMNSKSNKYVKIPRQTGVGVLFRPFASLCIFVLSWTRVCSYSLLDEHSTLLSLPLHSFWHIQIHNGLRGSFGGILLILCVWETGLVDVREAHWLTLVQSVRSIEQWGFEKENCSGLATKRRHPYVQYWLLKSDPKSSGDMHITQSGIINTKHVTWIAVHHKTKSDKLQGPFKTGLLFESIARKIVRSLTTEEGSCTIVCCTRYYYCLASAPALHSNKLDNNSINSIVYSVNNSKALLNWI